MKLFIFSILYLYLLSPTSYAFDALRANRTTVYDTARACVFFKGYGVRVFTDNDTGEYILRIHGHNNVESHSMSYYDCLDSALDHIPPNTDFTIELNHTGGSLYVMNEFAHKISAKCMRPKVWPDTPELWTEFDPKCKVTTIIKEGDKCNSSCIGLFMAGDYRIVEPGGTLGFHAMTIGYQSTQQVDAEAHIDGLLVIFGLHREWLIEQDEKTGVFRSLGITPLGPNDLQNSGALTPNKNSMQ